MASVLGPVVGLLLLEVVGGEELAREVPIPSQRAVVAIGAFRALETLQDLAQA